MGGAARMRRLRARQKAGLTPLLIEVDTDRLALALARHGMLGWDWDHCGDDAVARGRLAAALERALELLILTSEGVTASR